MSDIPEVLEVQVVPSVEVSMVAELPVATNKPLGVVVVVLLSSLLQEMTVKQKNGYENYM